MREYLRNTENTFPGAVRKLILSPGAMWKHKECETQVCVGWGYRMGRNGPSGSLQVLIRSLKSFCSVKRSQRRALKWEKGQGSVDWALPQQGRQDERLWPRTVAKEKVSKGIWEGSRYNPQDLKTWMGTVSGIRGFLFLMRILLLCDGSHT